MIRFTDNYRTEEHPVGPFVEGAIADLGEAIEAQVVLQGKAVYVDTPSDDGTMPSDAETELEELAEQEPEQEPADEDEEDAPESELPPEHEPEPAEEHAEDEPLEDESEEPAAALTEEEPAAEPATFTSGAAKAAEARGLTADDFEPGQRVTKADVDAFAPRK